MLRILLAGVVGGLLVFFGGFIGHAAFNWSGRTFTRLNDEEATVTFFRGQGLRPGIYGFPQMPEDLKGRPEAEQKIEAARVNAAFKEGPAAFIIVAPAGEDMMGPHTLISEAATDVGAALLVAWIVAQATSAGLFKRWLISVVFAVASWLSLIASYAIWYRFPGPFVHDELYCALLEWALAGLAIAVIVKPTPPEASHAPQQSTGAQGGPIPARA